MTHRPPSSSPDDAETALLDTITVPSPCTADWEAMAGDEQVRFCGQCQKSVYDLSSLSRAEAESLLLEREGKICVRLYTRDDGTVVTSDCPDGPRIRRRRRLAVSIALGGSALAVAGATGACTDSQAPAAAQSVAGDLRAAPDARAPDIADAQLPDAETVQAPGAEDAQAAANAEAPDAQDAQPVCKATPHGNAGTRGNHTMGVPSRDYWEKEQKGHGPKCDPPYTRDEKGVQHFKPECM